MLLQSSKMDYQSHTYDILHNGQSIHREIYIVPGKYTALHGGGWLSELNIDLLLGRIEGLSEIPRKQFQLQTSKASLSYSTNEETWRAPQSLQIHSVHLIKVCTNQENHVLHAFISNLVPAKTLKTLNQRDQAPPLRFSDFFAA